MPATTSTSRVLLVADRDGGTSRPADGPKVRRYKLARLELARPDDRFAHLKRSHD